MPLFEFYEFGSMVWKKSHRTHKSGLDESMPAHKYSKIRWRIWIQSLEAIQEKPYAKASLIGSEPIESAAQMENDVVRCQGILQTSYRTDVRPLLAKKLRP